VYVLYTVINILVSIVRKKEEKKTRRLPSSLTNGEENDVLYCKVPAHILETIKC
jgi:hypothetical protein